MLTYYQPFLFPFLRRHRYVLAGDVGRRHFLSFEDALWALLEHRKVPKGSVVLLPDYYCMDVVDNIRNHGFTPVLYPLDDRLQISKKRFDAMRGKHRAAVIVLFHACGITNALASDGKYLKSLCRSSIVIEDYVQRLLDPESVRIVHGNHFVMDSLRKVIPLSGGFIYGKRASMDFYPQHIPYEWKYIVVSRFLYFLFRSAFVLGVMLRSPALIAYAHKRILKRHDDLIGDSSHGYEGKRTDRFLHGFVDFAKVREMKRRQAGKYAGQLSVLPDRWYHAIQHQSDYPLLYAYPLGFRYRNARELSEIEAYFGRNGAPVWFKFADSPWANGRALLYLPLGFHVTDEDIALMARLIGNAPVS